jgi:hypothetical protein
VPDIRMQAKKVAERIAADVQVLHIQAHAGKA